MIHYSAILSLSYLQRKNKYSSKWGLNDSIKIDKPNCSVQRLDCQSDPPQKKSNEIKWTEFIHYRYKRNNDSTVYVYSPHSSAATQQEHKRHFIKSLM